ncbi:unnamed protein product, partial [Ascophyllum nodosum]
DGRCPAQDERCPAQDEQCLAKDGRCPAKDGRCPAEASTRGDVKCGARRQGSFSRERGPPRDNETPTVPGVRATRERRSRRYPSYDEAAEVKTGLKTREFPQRPDLHRL